MTARSREALVGDIGGTNARFAIADIDELVIDHFVSFNCRMFPSLQAAIEAYLSTLPFRPKMAALALAAPLRDETITLTNLDWSFTRADLAGATGVDDLLLLNDFEALALSLPHLAPHDLHRIGGGEPVAGAAKVVLGPGTGLGVAGLVHGEAGWVAVPSEGGHVSFAAQDVGEFEIVRRMSGGTDRISSERMISGPGLEEFHGVLCDMRSVPFEPMSVAEIMQAARQGENAVAEETVACFVRWLGRFAGDMALAFGARGGVYLGGGIAPRILDMLDRGDFRAAFEDKGRLSDFLRPVPVQIVKAGEATLRGAAFALSLR